MTIVSQTHNVRPHPSRDGSVGSSYLPGEDLAMSDGSLWFHPYTGAKPLQIRGPFSPRLV